MSQFRSLNSRAPAMPWVLGLGGLIPFIGLSAATYLAPAPYDTVSITGFYVYCAVILSFLGGARWGFELAMQPERPSALTLIGSNLPPLAAWFGVVLQLVQPMIGFGVLVGSLVLMWLWDAGSSGPGPRRLPHWYGRLRTVLTLVVLACCAALWWKIKG
jgi:Protein of unknown function (DUF3429)